MIIHVKKSGKINKKNNRIVSVMRKVYSKCQFPYIPSYLQYDQKSCRAFEVLKKKYSFTCQMCSVTQTFGFCSNSQSGRFLGIQVGQ